MQLNNTILSLTSDLLANGAFSHLSDESISALHHFILRLKEPLSTVQQNILLSYWSQANAENLPPALLQRYNGILQQLGRPTIEVMCIELEMY